MEIFLCDHVEMTHLFTNSVYTLFTTSTLHHLNMSVLIGGIWKNKNKISSNTWISSLMLYLIGSHLFYKITDNLYFEKNADIVSSFSENGDRMLGHEGLAWAKNDQMKLHKLKMMWNIQWKYEQCLICPAIFLQAQQFFLGVYPKGWMLLMVRAM